MWKKTDEETPYSTPEPKAAATPRGGRQEQATIGPSIKITGDLSGEEDLMIQGHVNGEIRLPKNRVTIGASGCSTVILSITCGAFGALCETDGDAHVRRSPSRSSTSRRARVRSVLNPCTLMRSSSWYPVEPPYGIGGLLNYYYREAAGAVGRLLAAYG